MWLASLALLKNYPSNRVVSRDTLFQQIGWDDLIKNPGYGNTWAIRVSLALIRSGVTIPGGRLPIKRIEPGQASNPPLATIYFPIQNRPKITPSKSSGVNCPVILES